jgi:anionic cell wall polymer biosynthesis LytR-Cps2A-Psr (LCP) family protein
MKKYLKIFLAIIIIGLGAWSAVRGVSWYRAGAAERAAAKARNEEIERVINSRRVEATDSGTADPFGEDGLARILLIGLDKRAGQTAGHCDAIQLIEIDRDKQIAIITAVPRGTYSPLPPGTGSTSSDYYVSNACGLGGLDYGVKQIEKILGVKADYLVVVGFSETLGILRNLKLPTTETLQWLRHRQGYAIGEPQRARNHSTFIKQMMTRFIPADISKMDIALGYMIYKIVQTDLSFAEVEVLAKALSAMDVANHPERVQLAMRPAYAVQDIPYAPEHLGEYLDSMIDPVKGLLSPDDYSGTKEDEIQAKLLEVINNKKENPEFIVWAFTNDLWLQIEDDDKRLFVQYDLLTRYTPQLADKTEREGVIADYILEMDHRGETVWAEKGRELLAKEFSS